MAEATTDRNKIGLETVLVELYSNILDLIFSLLWSITALRPIWAASVLRTYDSRPPEQLLIIRDLDARARAIEATLEEDIRKAQAEKRDEAMRTEISGIKHDIATLRTEMSEIGGMLKALLTLHGLCTCFKLLCVVHIC